MLPKTSTTRIGWVSVAEQERARRADRHVEVAPQEGEEGGHSRSSLPVRWM